MWPFYSLIKEKIKQIIYLGQTERQRSDISPWLMCPYTDISVVSINNPVSKERITMFLLWHEPHY